MGKTHYYEHHPDNAPKIAEAGHHRFWADHAPQKKTKHSKALLVKTPPEIPAEKLIDANLLYDGFKLLQQLQEEGYESPRLYWNRARIAKKTYDLKQTLLFLEKAFALNSDYLPALTLKAELTKDEDPKELVYLLQRINTLAPNNPETLSSLGHALLVVGQKVEAEAAFRHSLTLNPKQKKVEEALNLFDQTLLSAEQLPKIKNQRILVIADHYPPTQKSKEYGQDFFTQRIMEFKELDRTIENSIQQRINNLDKILAEKGIDQKKFTSSKVIIEKLEQNRRNRTVCHILGSGPTVIETIKQTDLTTDAFFHCNFSGLLGLPSDLYVVELTTTTPPHKKELSDLQWKLISRCQHRDQNILVKNTWGSGVDSTINNLQPVYLRVKDILLPQCQLLGALNMFSYMFNKILERRDDILVQYLTTPFTLVLFAHWAGYKTIVLHGIDGTGGHFFETYSVHSDLSDKLLTLQKPNKGRHEVGYPAAQLIPTFKKVLENKGTNLLRGNDFRRS